MLFPFSLRDSFGTGMNLHQHQQREQRNLELNSEIKIILLTGIQCISHPGDLCVLLQAVVLCCRAAVLNSEVNWLMC